MRIPISWLKEFVKINISTKELAERLTMSGLETQVIDGNILDVDVLPNRGDCLSVIGIAREVKALLK